MTAGNEAGKLQYDMKKPLPFLILILLILLACSREDPREIMDTVGNSALPAIQAVVKAQTIIATPTVTPESAGFSESLIVSKQEPLVTDLVLKLADFIEQAKNAATETEMKEVDKAIESLEGSGLLDQLETALENTIAERAAKGAQAAPGLQLALSAVYGRKGMAEKAYAAILAAEKTATEPGVSFNLALIHGRKALLAPGSKNGSFSLVVHCTIPDAILTLDGIEQGSPPLRLEALREGRHEVRIQAPGYEPLQLTVEGSDGETNELDASLNALPVRASIVTIPPGATLLIDGDIVGVTSWEGTIIPGRHTISATLRGHESALKTVEALPGSVMEPVSFNLQPIFAFMQVTATITNVEVYIDGELKGIAPVRLKVPVETPIRIRLAPIDWWFGAQQRIITLAA